MKDLDAWAAEKCGVAVHTEGSERLYIDRFQKHDIYEPVEIFTLSDARCREIVREHLQIITNVSYNPNYKWMAHQHFHTDWIHGESIEEAEIACIQAIMDAE